MKPQSTQMTRENSMYQSTPTNQVARKSSLWSWIMLIALSVVGLLAASGCAEPVYQSSASVNINVDQEPQDPAKKTEQTGEKTTAKMTDKNDDKKAKMETATFGAGCFWCVEAIFQQLEGVKAVRSGYMGGHVDNPTYKQVCTGTTGHAEVIQVDFDPDVISFEELLEVFWKTHDPTTLNQQGADTGTQYRSAVFFHNKTQKERAEFYKKKLNEAKAFSSPIVTEVSEATKMYVAEDYHQNYFNNNQGNPYCRAVIPPKLEKLKRIFGDKLKKK